MTTFKVIAIGTTIINNDFIFDNWIYGNVFNNLWSPYPEPNFKKEELRYIKYCFISHIHQDHWDLDTIKFFNKETIFYIPDLPFNYVIGNTLAHKGFSKIKYLKMGSWYDISRDYLINIVPPLNADGAETQQVKDKDNGAIAIDTGLLIKIKKDKSNHLLMGDNVPYDMKIYDKFFKKEKISSFFFPHNGYAIDFPLCYDNFTEDQKRKISNKKSIITERVFIDFIKKIKPKVLVPFSAQFSINSLRKKEFHKINSEVFFHKDLYCKRIEKITKIPSACLYEEDIMKYKYGNFQVDTKSDFFSRRKVRRRVKISLPEPSKNNKSLTDLLNVSLKNYFIRVKKYKVNISLFNDWNFVIKVQKNFYNINFKNKEITNTFDKKGKYLLLKVSNKILRCILERKLHINNCMVSFILSWERKPNYYNKLLYDSLSFLHI